MRANFLQFVSTARVCVLDKFGNISCNVDTTSGKSSKEEATLPNTSASCKSCQERAKIDMQIKFESQGLLSFLAAGRWRDQHWCYFRDIHLLISETFALVLPQGFPLPAQVTSHSAEENLMHFSCHFCCASMLVREIRYIISFSPLYPGVGQRKMQLFYLLTLPLLVKCQ